MPSSILVWMSAIANSQEITKPMQREAGQRLVKKNLKLHIDRESQAQIEADLRLHEKKYLEREGLELQDDYTLITHDLQVYLTGEEWRDLIHRQLQMHRLRVDFVHMKMDRPPVTGSGIVVLDYANKGKAQLQAKAARYYQKL